MTGHERHVRVAIAGGGFGGLGAAIRLRQAGVDDLVVLERAGEAGGTWRDNTYPGCTCDVPSHLYSYSFAPNPDWSRSFSPQPEIHAYLRGCVDRFGLAGHLRPGHEVTGARWDDQRRHWRVTTTRGTWTADVLVAATGPLSDPAVPDLPGAATFRGERFHAARWNHDLDLTGRRVGVVGTGASAAQIVPAIAPRAGHLTVFQRTPAWVMPRRDRPITPAERALYRHVPAAQRLARAAIHWGREAQTQTFLHPRLMRVARRAALRHLERSVPDPALRARLTPGYDPGCKRIVLSDDYLATFTRPDVTLADAAVTALRPHGVVTADGAEHQVDTLVFATGFHVTDAPVAGLVHGRDGRTLAETWQGSPKAHLGTMVTGFPNLFLLLGPNTGLGSTSVVLMIEAQLDLLLAALGHLGRTGAAALEPDPAAQAAFVAEVDRRMRPTVWATGGCASWYVDATGRNSTIWPGTTRAFRRRLRRLDPADYRLTPPPPAPATPPAPLVPTLGTPA